MKWLSAVTALLTTGLLTSCASTVTMTDEERNKAYEDFIVSEKLESKLRVNTFRLYDWSELGEKHLILSASPSKPYLIRLKARCPELKHEYTIGVHNTNSTLDAKFDSISVGSHIPHKCFIESIYPITKEQKKLLLKIGISKEDT